MRKIQKIVGVLCIIGFLIVSSRGIDKVRASTLQPNYPGNDTWNLVLEDNFDTLNTDLWRVVGVPGAGHQPYYDSRCTSVEDGKLKLKIMKNEQGKGVLGRVDTKDNFTQKYGFFECRADIPPVDGTYFAFWLTIYPGKNIIGNGGRDGAEIDICETIYKGDYTTTAIHWDGTTHSVGSGKNPAPNIHDGYHIYGMEWNENTLNFYFDGQLTYTYSGEGVPRVAEYVIFSSGADPAGTWVEGNYEDADLPYYSKVDWIRIYQKEDTVNPPVTGKVYECEDLTTTSSTGDNQLDIVDGLCSGDKFNKLDSNAIGDYVEYSVNVEEAGTYEVKVGNKTAHGRATYQLAIDSNDQGGTIDQYEATASYPESDLGQVTFSTSGIKKFRFKVVGKNASSSNYKLAFDYIKLIKQ